MDFLTSLYPFILDWLDLIVRWFHIIVGIAWIGTSFYFNWLDSRLDRDLKDEKIDGELWSVHSGGFYHINKLKGPPTTFPKELHWFKWEAYSTWISGFVLLILVYYLNAESIMIDKNVNDINVFIAIVISLSFLLGSWLIYDFLCKSSLINNSLLFTVSCFPSTACINVCQAKVAHLTLIGNCFTPERDIIVVFSSLLRLLMFNFDPSFSISRKFSKIFCNLLSFFSLSKKLFNFFFAAGVPGLGLKIKE